MNPLQRGESRSILAHPVALIGFLVLLVTSSSAHAAARSVVLIPFLGGAQIAQRIEHDLGSLYDVADGSANGSLAQRLALPTQSDWGPAGALRIDALISGEVRLVDGHTWLATVVREARTGRVLGRSDYDLSLESIDDVVCDLIFALAAVDPISQPPDES